MTGIVALIVNLLIGAAGGNLAGMALKDKSLGLLWNSVVGILGGGIGYFVLGFAGIGGGNIIVQVLAALIGGGVLLFVVSLIKKKS